MKSRELRVAADERLDRALAEADPELSRRKARTLIAAGLVFVDGHRCKVASRRVAKGARLVVHQAAETVEQPFDLIYQDEEVWVINKHPGLACNMSESSARLSVVECLGHHAKIVHRLDRDTSGVMVVAKTPAAVRSLSAAFADRTVKKQYVAVVEGCPEDQDVDAPLGQKPHRPHLFAVKEGGKPAFTQIQRAFCVAEVGGVRLVPLTGRTHQLRVHLAHLHHPILGDVVYGGPAAVRLKGEVVRCKRPLLHAYALEIPLAGTMRRFTAPVAEDILQFGDFELE